MHHTQLILSLSSGRGQGGVNIGKMNVSGISTLVVVNFNLPQQKGLGNQRLPKPTFDIYQIGKILNIALSL